jgi:hypothetical protein
MERNVTKQRRGRAAAGVSIRGILQDLRYAFRGLRHSPGFTFWVAGSLAVGMAVTIAAFAFLIAMLMGPFPGVSSQNRLVRVSLSENCGAPDCWRRMSSPDDLLNIREGLTGLSGLAGYTAGQVTVALPEARSVRGVFATPDYFEVGRSWCGPRVMLRIRDA